MAEASQSYEYQEDLVLVVDSSEIIICDWPRQPTHPLNTPCTDRTFQLAFYMTSIKFIAN
jgi:hypothetical protein